MQVYLRLGREIYQNKKASDYRRMIVFIIRALLNHGGMKELKKFFEANSLRRNIITANPPIFEQVTRSLFYRNSTFNERLFLIQQHFIFLEKVFTPEALEQIYIGNGIELWNSEYHEEKMSLQLDFDLGQKKEGLVSINLTIGDRNIYQIIFWLAPNRNGEMSIWIGALQGAQGGLDVARSLTKQFLGYRPKNVVVQALRMFASKLEISHIYAVSNYGFYANNHIRLDRKLKTSLDDFWQETGGEVCNDSRFFELPVVEPRKDLMDVPSKKRNLYRKRFAGIDRVDGVIKEQLGKKIKVQ